MKQLGIVTDSAASIPQELVEKYELDIVPMGIQMDGRVVRDGVDLTAEQFYALMDETKGMTTSQPSPGDFMQVYRQAAAKAKEILAIHITAQASGTLQVAHLVKESLEAKITLFDSASCSMGQGFMAIEAAKAALQGYSVDEIISRLEVMRENMSVYAAVPTLKYLAASGKVSKVKALLAGLLNIKPIIGMCQGVAEVVGRVRSYPKALEAIIALVEERYPNSPLNVAVLHTNAPKQAEEYRRLVERKLNCAWVVVAEMGSALAVHGGQGMLGLAAYPVREDATGKGFCGVGSEV